MSSSEVSKVHWAPGVKKHVEEEASTPSTTPDVSSNNVAKALTQKVGTKEWWADVERRDLNQEKVSEAGKNYISSVQSSTETSAKLLRVDGAEIYNSVRGELATLDVTISETKTPLEKKKMSKTQALQNELKIKSRKTTIKEIHTIINFPKKGEMFSFENRTRNLFKSDFSFEMNGVVMMMLMDYILKNEKKSARNREDISSRTKIHLGVAAQKLVDYTASCTDESVSETFKADIKKSTEGYLEVVKCDHATIFSVARECVYTTNFDFLIPEAGIQLRDHQKEFVDVCRKHFPTNGALVYYKAMIGSGKTSAAPLLALLLRTFSKRPKLLFACNTETVRFDVAKMCFNSGVKFGYSYFHRFTKKELESANGAKNTKEGEFRVVRNYNCKTDADLEVIICDPRGAKNFLITTKTAKDEYILFLDEPTQGADIAKSASLVANVDLIMTAVKNIHRIVLSSATINQHMTDVNELFTKCHPGATVTTILSTDILIGCDMFTMEGHRIVPHQHIETSSELSKLVSNIREMPFPGRMYTYDVLRELDPVGIGSRLPTIKSLSGNNIKKVCLEILDSYSNSDETVRLKCGLKMTCDDVVNVAGIENGDVFQNPHGTTLFVTRKPAEELAMSFKDTITEFRKRYTSIDKFLKDYSSRLEKYNRDMSTLEKSLNDESRRGEKLSQLDREKTKSECNSGAPMFGVPSEMYIGSQQFFNSKSKGVSSARLQHQFTFSEISELTVPEEVIIMLLCGVGVYSEEYAGGKYTQLVLPLAAEGKLAYIFADDSICYGTNFPINRIIINEDFASSHSVNTLYQTLGRAGRMFKSYQATAYISESTAKRLLDAIKSPENFDVESENIVAMMKSNL